MDMFHQPEGVSRGGGRSIKVGISAFLFGGCCMGERYFTETVNTTEESGNIVIQSDGRLYIVLG